MDATPQTQRFLWCCGRRKWPAAAAAGSAIRAAVRSARLAAAAADFGMLLPPQTPLTKTAAFLSKFIDVFKVWRVQRCDNKCLKTRSKKRQKDRGLFWKNKNFVQSFLSLKKHTLSSLFVSQPGGGHPPTAGFCDSMLLRPARRTKKSHKHTCISPNGQTVK